MSETLGSRVRAARAAVRMSQRAFAKALGVSFGAVQSWERERTLPNGAALAAICKLGFDGHWLVTGEGVMWRAERSTIAGATAADGSDAATPADSAILSQLKEIERTPLGEILLLSRRGLQENLWRTLQVVFDGPRGGMSEAQILAMRVERSPDSVLGAADVAADCLLLQAERLLEPVAGSSPRRWRLSEPTVLRPGQYVDRLQAVKEAVDTLCSTVAPGLSLPDRRSYLLNHLLFVPDGRAFVRSFRELIMEHLRSAESEDGESVHLVIAAAAVVDP